MLQYEFPDECHYTLSDTGHHAASKLSIVPLFQKETRVVLEITDALQRGKKPQNAIVRNRYIDLNVTSGCPTAFPVNPKFANVIA